MIYTLALWTLAAIGALCVARLIATAIERAIDLFNKFD